MDATPVLRTTPEQMARLIAACTRYRAYLWHTALPSSERNQLIRSVLALQARVRREWEQQRGEEVRLLLNAGEQQTVRQMLSGLLQMVAAGPVSEERTRQLSELAGLRLLIERSVRSFPV